MADPNAPTPPSSPARINPLGPPTTPASTLDAPFAEPGKGGWVPGALTVVFASVGVAALSAGAHAVSQSLPAPWGVIAGACLGALATGIAAALGIKSAGPRAQ